MNTNRKFLKVMQSKIGAIALAVGIMLALVGPFYAAPATAQAAEALSLLQFTAGGHALGFTPQGMVAATGSHALRVDFVNANSIQPQADASANSQSASLGRVTYADLWEGVSLEYAASAGSIYTTTYTLAPGADAKNIRLRYNAPLTLNQNGTLSIAFKTGTLTESAPIAWQNINSRREPVDVSFRVSGNEVSFALGQYDPRHALTIDPTLTWNTFLGGSAEDDGRAIAVDGSGNVYVAGNSSAPWGSSVRAYSVGRDGFVAKLDSSGLLAWNTFLGGSGTDAANGIALDGSGNIYVVGDSSADWGCQPEYFVCTVNAFAGGIDAFAAKLDSTGFLHWNTFIGNTYTDYGTAIAVDTSSNPNVIWVALDWQRLWNFNLDFEAVANKLDMSGNFIAGETLGAPYPGDDFVNGIAVDGSGNIYVTGDSNATWGSPVRAHYGAGNTDAFVAKLDSSTNLLWNTFLGGSGTDHGYGIAVDGSGDVYVTGESNAAWTCPTVSGCTVNSYSSGTDAFVARLQGLAGIIGPGSMWWNTFLSFPSGSGNDSGHGIVVDGSGNVFVTGYIWYEFTATPNNDAFAARFSASSGALINNYMFGDNGGQDYGNGIAVKGGDVYVAGASADTWGNPVQPHDISFAPDAFVAKVYFLSKIYLPLVIR